MKSGNLSYLFETIVFSVIIIFPTTLCAQKDKPTVFDRFTFDDLVKIELSCDFSSLDSLKNTNTYQEANITYEDETGVTVSWDLKVRPRGRFRRKVCQNVPLKLNFSKDDLDDQELRKDDELKLVTQCLNTPEGKDYVLKEYLVYKLYNILSPVSLRAQLLRITYVDTGTGRRQKGYGVLLEDEKTIARRENAKVCDDCFSLKKEDFDPNSLHVASLFQYLIGNADYSVTLGRNMLLLEPKDDDQKFKVAPYDFDFCGLVGASYAIANPDYNLETTKDRIFIGMGTDEDMQPFIDYFKEKRAELNKTVMDFKSLGKMYRKEIIEYLDSFYDSIEEQGLIRPEQVITY